MHLSFTNSRPKTLFSWEIRVLLLFFSSVTVLMFVVYAFMMYRIYDFEDAMIVAKVRIHKLDDERTSMQQRIEFIQVQANNAKLIYTNNQLLSDSIKNLFDIIPDKITLQKAFLDKESLVLYGQTPTKELYKFLLLAPLRSIFDESITSYYQLPNGWFNFVSTNTMKPSKTEDNPVSKEELDE